MPSSSVSPSPSSPARSEITLIHSAESPNDNEQSEKNSSKGSSLIMDSTRLGEGEKGEKGECEVRVGKGEREYLWVEWEENDPG